MSPNPRDSAERSCTFLAKHRANPWQEQEFRGANWRDVWERAQYDMGIYKANIPPFCIDLAAATQGFEIENEAARKVLQSSKNQHACR